jgi:hypothetical protein
MRTSSGFNKGIIQPWSQRIPASRHQGSILRVKATLGPSRINSKHGESHFSPQRPHHTHRQVPPPTCTATAPGSAWESSPQSRHPSSDTAVKVRSVAGMLVACLLAVGIRKLLTLLAVGSQAPELACMCAVGFLSTPALRKAHWRVGSASLSPGAPSDQRLKLLCTTR